MADADPPTDELEALPDASQATTALAEPSVIAAGRRVGERYRLERPLGRGGMAAVWLATDERLGRPVAVKILSDTLTSDEEYLARFSREARTAAGLQHPNLVPVYDYGAGERPFLVMEYVECGDLAERIRAGDVPDPEQLAVEMLGALRHIHSAGVLHRDIKPQNVLIDAEGRARLTDFGIAQPRDAVSLTKTGNLIGTETYIAPELKKGESASERSDLYALGVVLAEITAPGDDGPLPQLVGRLRAEDPEQRPRTAAAALAVLERSLTPTVAAPAPIADPEPATELAPPPPPPPPPESRSFEPTSGAAPSRGRAGLVIALVALLGAALAVGLILSGDDGDKQPARQASSNTANENSNGNNGEGQADEAAAADEAAPAAEAPVEEPPAEEPAASAASTDGAALNDEGYALLQSGDAEGAVPVLEQAVEALRGSGDELTYNYALYNLGSALLESGRAEEAIPYLEERLSYDDGQLGTVQATLDEAYAAAGQEPPAGEEDD